MKTSIAKLAAGLAIMTVSSVAMAAGAPGTGIATTKHNLGASGSFNFTNATTEICVFCHTPHGADTSAQAPLWNRTLGTPSDYQSYSSLGTSTLDGATAPVGSVSLACLSCHDGTQAMNVVINSPGSGTSGSVGVGTDCAASATGCGAPNTGGFFEFTAMSDVSGEMIYLATDLRNDHPIGIQYGGGAGTETNGYKDPDFKKATSTTVNSQTVWYVDAFGAASPGKQKSDIILYTRTETAGTGSPEPFVECASCHDPHTNNTTFLRNPAGNDGSATCLSCHTK